MQYQIPFTMNEISFEIPKILSHLCFRFHASPELWQYSIQISDCSFASDNTSIVTPACPIQVATRKYSLPDMEEHVMQHDCEDTGQCNISVERPAADAWNHITFAVNATGNLTFTYALQAHGMNFIALCNLYSLSNLDIA